MVDLQAAVLNGRKAQHRLACSASGSREARASIRKKGSSSCGLKGEKEWCFWWWLACSRVDRESLRLGTDWEWQGGGLEQGLKKGAGFANRREIWWQFTA